MISLRSTEFVFARRHHTDGCLAFNLAESDGFDGAVEVLVNLEHGRFLMKGLKRACQYAQRAKPRHF